ncbi:MAG: LacI family DNA-binding transcriptional regulator [Saprospiraceae bacterium]
MKRINIKDLAKMLSLNPSTVSRALSDHPDIKTETKERVRAAAKEFNYQPNLRAKYFRQKTSGLIALILPELNMFFVPQLMEGINDVLQDSDSSIIIFISNNSFERESEIVNHCINWSVDGVLISLSENTADVKHLMQLKESDIPVVILDKVVTSDQFTTITIDDKLAAYDATRYLINNDKRNILGIFGNPTLEITRQRVEGFSQALKEENIPTSSYDVIFINQEKDVNEKLDPKLRKTPYDAAFVMSDELLMFSITSLRKYNLYPNVISMVVISDGKLPYQLHPRVSHIKHSGIEIGKTAARRLLLMKDAQQKVQHIKIPTQLISLESIFT